LPGHTPAREAGRGAEPRHVGADPRDDLPGGEPVPQGERLGGEPVPQGERLGGGGPEPANLLGPSPPLAGTRTQATTVCLCTSSPARAMSTQKNGR